MTKAGNCKRKSPEKLIENKADYKATVEILSCMIVKTSYESGDNRNLRVFGQFHI